ncbi:MAG: hypothetical protein ACKO7N_05375 [Candidatus Nitrosotenuis sp.]
MKTKFAGACRQCGKSWNVGDELLYSKDPKAVCVDQACFEKQKGVIARAVEAGTFARVQNTKSNWPQMGELSPELVGLVGAEEIYCALAYKIASARHPGLSDREIGPIVNATMQNLIAIAQIKAIREREK